MKQNIKKGRYLFYEGEVYDLGGGDDGQAMAKAEEALTAAQAAQTTADGAATAAGNAQTAADGKAPIYHASENNTYGVGDYLHYGHVKLADTPNASMQAGDGYAATPAAVQAAIDQGKWTLLWENASPTSAFQSQTITVQGASAYDFLVFVYYADNNAITVLPVCLCPRGSGAYVTGGFSGTMCRRYSTASGDNIWFSTANQVSGTAPSNLQNAIIPWTIYGFNLN